METSLKKALQQLGIKFNQEVRIGRYSADFALIKRKIAIEADSDYWHDAEKDRKRDVVLKKYGWITIRFSEKEIVDSSSLKKLIKTRLREALN